MQQNLIN